MPHMRTDALSSGGPPPEKMSRQIRLTAEPQAPSRARTYARRVLTEVAPPLGAEQVDDVCLIVSELVTNAYRYGSEPGDLVLVAVEAGPNQVRVEVHDPRRRPPQVRTESDERARGRGLHIVEALSLRWGVDSRPFGKIVWVEVAR
ncbi:ATP-binding protein [Streptomyces sp. B21-097]|uniref:ATP-binding protein n=1 Tax=Streptomyces sp. B21-097 TaxID=3039414 RepID=UPI002FEEF596